MKQDEYGIKVKMWMVSLWKMVIFVLQYAQRHWRDNLCTRYSNQVLKMEDVLFVSIGMIQQTNTLFRLILNKAIGNLILLQNAFA